MKQLKSKIKFSSRNFILLRFVLSFLVLIVLTSSYLVAQIRPDVVTATSQNSAEANVAATPTSVVPGAPEVNKPNLPEKKRELSTENLVYAGDTLDVDVLGSLEYDWRGKTDDEGFLSDLPYLDISILALCRTEDEIAGEITAAYSKLVRNPQVVVRVLDRSNRLPAMLLGAISTPQRFQIQRSIQLNELLVMSGGITDKASGEVNIFRPAHTSCTGRNQNQIVSQFINVKLTDLLSGKVDANPRIEAGDVVTVEEAVPIYVIGNRIADAAAAPQRILFRPGITLSRIIASVGVSNRNGGERAQITIYRRQKDRPELQIMAANLEQITNQKAADILMEAYDIVEISQNRQTRRDIVHPPVVNAVETKQFDVNKLPIRLVN